MSRIIPFGSPRYRGHTDGVLPRKFEGALVAGVAVSRVEVDASQPTVKPFDGSNFAGFAVHDIDNTRGVTGVIKHGEAICVKPKAGETFTVGNGFAVDNATGEVVPAGSADSTQINGEIEEVGVIGLDENCNEVPDSILVNLYGGIVYGSAAGAAVTSVNGKTGDVTLAAADLGALEDAPSDGTTYGRKDGAWADTAVAAAMAELPESDTKTASRTKK